jgi:hypothetical protein
MQNHQLPTLIQIKAALKLFKLLYIIILDPMGNLVSYFTNIGWIETLANSMIVTNIVTQSNMSFGQLLSVSYMCKAALDTLI